MIRVVSAERSPLQLKFGPASEMGRKTTRPLNSSNLRIKLFGEGLMLALGFAALNHLCVF